MITGELSANLTLGIMEGLPVDVGETAAFSYRVDRRQTGS